MIEDLCPSVSVARVDSHGYRDIETSLKAAFEDLGGLDRLVKPGMRVFLKPDLPAGETSSSSVDAYLRLLTAVGRAVVACGATVRLGDSMLFSRERIERVWDRIRLAEISRAIGIEPVNLERAGTRPVIRQRRVYYISRAASESDLVINLPRMRSDASGFYRGAVWNLIGLLPGHQKIKTLQSLGGPDGIAEMCADILSAVSPDLNIMFVRSENDTRGKMDRVSSCHGTLFASVDAVALDTVVSRLAGYEPESDPVLAAASDAGLGIGRTEGIRVQYLTERPESFSTRPAGGLRGGRRLHGLAMGVISSALTARLEIDGSRCSACGVCINNCHINGLTDKSGRGEPAWRESVCVHCWTCVENCPLQALKIRWGLLSGGALRFWRRICDV